MTEYDQILRHDLANILINEILPSPSADISLYKATEEEKHHIA